MSVEAMMEKKKPVNLKEKRKLANTLNKVFANIGLSKSQGKEQYA